MYRKLMVAVDNSEHSNLAVELAIQIAGTVKAELTGVHVCAAQLHDVRFQQLEPGLPDRYQSEERLTHLRGAHDDLIGRGLGIIADSYLDHFERRCKEQDVPARAKGPRGSKLRPTRQRQS